jgi:hypothetical protein
VRRGRCRISAANFVELSIVIEGQFGAVDFPFLIQAKFRAADNWLAGDLGAKHHGRVI